MPQRSKSDNDCPVSAPGTITFYASQQNAEPKAIIPVNCSSDWIVAHNSAMRHKFFDAVRKMKAIKRFSAHVQRFYLSVLLQTLTYGESRNGCSFGLAV
jgi:hypothetical protein